MSTSPSPSQVSAGSNNSTDCFQDILSQQLSVDASMRDESLVPREALAYTPQPSEILKVSVLRASAITNALVYWPLVFPGICK